MAGSRQNDAALIEAVFVDVFLDAHAVPPPQITLDLDGNYLRIFRAAVS